MADNWVDWECEDNQASAVPSAERIKQLQERKLIEEADNALTRELFAIGNVADTKPPAKKKSGRSLVKAQRR
jgi:RNA polymerase-interacting CarD/CdnL/TRCF family regulator